MPDSGKQAAFGLWLVGSEGISRAETQRRRGDRRVAYQSNLSVSAGGYYLLEGKSLELGGWEGEIRAKD